MKGLNEYENKNKKPNNNIYIQKISKEFFNEKIYFYENLNQKLRWYLFLIWLDKLCQ